jgi:ubiquinone/menaquinone biosynthesis C-methylase UbiE
MPIMPAAKVDILPAKLSKSQVISTYRALASSYDLWAQLTEAAARKRALELAAIRGGEAILEIAVGTGLLFEEVVKQNRQGRNEGIDLTDAMLERAKARLSKLIGASHSLRVGDAYDLPFGDVEFDLVLNNYMFDLLPEADFPRVLSEMKRVLKPGGRLILVNMTTGEGLLDRAWTRLYKVSPSLLGGCRAVELSGFVKESGFERVERDVVRQLGFPSEVLRAWKTTTDAL